MSTYDNVNSEFDLNESINVYYSRSMHIFLVALLLCPSYYTPKLTEYEIKKVSTKLARLFKYIIVFADVEARFTFV